MKKRAMKTMDGNTAAAKVSYAFTDVAAIYPITPSSTMAEVVDEMAANGHKNAFDQTVKVVEMQSEAGAAGAVHGSLVAGALTTTYTASQGLLLMIPNMYKIAGELLPAVFHVSARTLATHALCIFGDHSDVMACRQTGFAMLCSASVQEVMDLGGVAHLSAIKGSVPFLHFFDGFRTSHEIQKIEVIDDSEFAALLDRDAVQKFRDRALNPENPKTMGTAQNPDIFFQAREAAQPYYNKLPAIVEEYMAEISKITGRKYNLFDYIGAPDAERVIVAMGSVCETAEEVVNMLLAKGEKVGLIKVRLYRPWSTEHFMKALPSSVKKITVLDRTKETGAFGDPLYMDVKGTLYDEKNAPEVYAGRYGLGSKDTTPGQILAVFENLKKSEPKNKFTIGIVDDVNNSSLDYGHLVTEPEGTVRCKFWGLGSDGTVGANKEAIKIIGNKTDLFAQGYFDYDSKKSGGLTISHLRFGKNKIQSTYLVNESDFVACHNQAYTRQYDLLDGLRKGGTFVLNCVWSEAELEKELPNSLKKVLAEKQANFYIINANAIAEEIGLGNRINMIMQSVFFKLANVIPVDEAIAYLKESVVDAYGLKGEHIVKMNQLAIDKGLEMAKKVDVPAEWANLTPEVKEYDDMPEFIRDVLIPMTAHKGDELPVSTFADIPGGNFPAGTSAYEKRGVAAQVPEWQIDNCIQCNQCSFVCPHAAIRPVLVTEAEMENAPEQFKVLNATGKGFEGLKYRMQVSPLDCLGCGNCADICPAKNKALIMKHTGTQSEQIDNWTFGTKVPLKDNILPKDSIKGSQFAQPYIEFSGACAGCGETPYIKLVTQLFGDRMMIANATGCSSIWGASAPSMPYTKDANGRGPSWANSLFEDNAEFGLGMLSAVSQMRNKLKNLIIELAACDIDSNLKAALDDWVANVSVGDNTRERADKVVSLIESSGLSGKAKELADEILLKKEHLIKRSLWCLGGDGWSYDIGYGGLDHVLASGEDINVLVFDTEVYSNTGGQASKSTPTGAVAKFAAAGKRVKKKDLGMMAASYGYVYVAQVGMGADKAQLLKAIKEAEAYNGPSLIICYAPCINHGLRQGMGKTQQNTKDAVAAGYWHLYRYNPQLKAEGKNPFILDSKEPTESFRDFIMNQVRYSSLVKTFPDIAEELFEQTEQNARERYEKYKAMAAE